MKMTHADATKKLKTEKPRENYLVVTIDARLVMPHRDGLKLIEALASAERLARYSSDTPPIESLDEYTLQSRVMGPEEYRRHKMAQLMGLSLRDLDQVEAETPQSTATT